MKIFILIILAVMVSCASTPKKKDEVMIMDKKARLYYDQGTQELADKEYTIALTHLKKAAELAPENTHILNNLGMAYYFKGASGTAINYLKKSIKLDAKNTAARMNLATIYMKNKQYDLAEKEYINITKDLTYMAQFRTYYNLGILNLEKNNMKDSIMYFEKSIKENENYCPAHYQLGQYYYKNKDYKKAYKKYQDAGFGVCYNNPIPHYHQAEALIKLGQFEKARVTLNKIIQKFGNTKYKDIAQNKIQELNRIEQYHNLDQNSSDHSARKILTPSF